MIQPCRFCGYPGISTETGDYCTNFLCGKGEYIIPNSHRQAVIAQWNERYESMEKAVRFALNVLSELNANQELLTLQLATTIKVLQQAIEDKTNE